MLSNQSTQELYVLVFLSRYLDLFTNFVSVYNTVMKLVFIGSSLAIVWCMRMHKVVKRSYNKELDTFRHDFSWGMLCVGPPYPRGIHISRGDIIDVLWAFSIYLEAVSILPQAYRALYILNWIYRYFTEPKFGRWIACIAGLVQTALYGDFFYYYFRSWKNNAKLQLPA
ncbi:ER lumen protein retaining receptor family protein [Prunus dulcis]|uniref:ER lumen protein retaining receptor family protein n=1 Tax=Prunus dulcis TaxID=3755 RepID=A0A4Y1R9Z1_PRUDU|nr:ER lumen protein retaining receptor family protein [Prunus dulcis]